MTNITKFDEQLIEASRNGDIKSMTEALEKGANPSVHFRQTLEEITPLVLCATKGYDKCVELLLKYKADVNERMVFGHATPLLLVVSNENDKCVDILLKNGSNPNQCDKLGRTALMDAAETGNTSIVKLLLSHNADVDMEDKEQRTALSYALDFVEKKDKKWYNVCKILVLEHNADCTKKGRSTDRTLLHCAAAIGDFDLVKKLVEEKNVNILEYDTSQFTPIMYANKAGYNNIGEYLTQKANSGCCIIL